MTQEMRCDVGCDDDHGDHLLDVSLYSDGCREDVLIAVDDLQLFLDLICLPLPLQKIVEDLSHLPLEYCAESVPAKISTSFTQVTLFHLLRCSGFGEFVVVQRLVDIFKRSDRK